MALIELHFHITKDTLTMAVSDAFQAQLDRLAALVSTDRSNQAVTIADAVRAQAEADQAAINDAKAEAASQAQADAADKAALQEQVDALTKALDALSDPAPVEAAPAGDAPAPEEAVAAEF